MMKKLVPLAALLVAALIIVSSGAFTSVTADRTATVTVVGDDSALLALVSLNSAYAGQDTDGIFSIDVLTCNKNATTTFGDLFKIVNNGTQAVDITLSWTGPTNGDIVFTTSASESGYTVNALSTFGATSSATISIAAGSEVYVSMGVMTTTEPVTTTLTITAEA